MILCDQHDLQVADVGVRGTRADQIAETIEERVGVVVVQIRDADSMPAAAARAIVDRSTIAPAASVGPSMPSVPMLAAATSHCDVGECGSHGKRKLLIASSLSGARDRDRGFTRRDHAGWPREAAREALQQGDVSCSGDRGPRR